MLLDTLYTRLDYSSDQDRVELLVGVPGPVPLQKRFRAIAMQKSELVPVSAACHKHAESASDTKH